MVTAVVMLALVAALVLAALAGGEDPERRATGEPQEAPASTTNSTDPAPTATPSTTSGARRSVAPAGWSTHTDPDTGYRLSYPAGWRVEDRDGTRTDFVDPGTGTYLRVDWTDEPGDSPEAAWEAQSESFGSRHANYREIRIEPTTYKGHRAALWEYTYEAGGASLHAYNLGFVTGDYGFALNFQTREDQWPASGPLWDTLKANFQVPAGDD